MHCLTQPNLDPKIVGMKRPLVRVKFEYEGASPGALKWSQMRAMVDAIAEAVHNVAPELDADDIIPVEVKAGSVEFAMQAPAKTSAALAKLAKRPLNGAAPALKALARSLGADVYVAGARSEWKALSFEEPVQRLKSRISSTSSYVVFVEDIGGADPRVRLKLPNDDMLIAKADEEVIQKLGPYIYREVRATIHTEFDAETMKAISRRLVAFEAFEPLRLPKIVIPSAPDEDLEFKSVAEFLESRHH